EVHQARNSSRRGNKIPFRRRIDSSKPTCRQNRCCKNGSDHRFVFQADPKEDYIAFMPKPNVRTALHNLAVAIEHYNENHPHSALGYRSPREYRRQRVTLT
ncbi:integrase core domain-containing protein, partial [Escherichia coli]